MLNFGIVGLGRIGKVHLSNIQRHCNNAKVIAASPVKSKDKGFLNDNGVEFHFDHYDQMVKEPKLDAIIIASPTAFHYEHILLAAKAGKHIFCEKPIDLNYEKVKTVSEMVASAGIHFMLGFNRRFDPHIMQLKKAIKMGKAGTPRIIKITSRDPEPPPIDFIKNSGGLFLDMSIHDFDMARYLVEDEVVQVTANGMVFGDLEMEKYDDIDTAVITLIFKKGCMVQIDNSRYSSYGYDQRVEVFGEKGMVATQNVLEDKIIRADKLGHHNSRAKYFFIERYSDSYRNELTDFVKTLQSKKAPSVSAEDGLASLAIAIAAKRSLKESKPVKMS